MRKEEGQRGGNITFNIGIFVNIFAMLPFTILAILSFSFKYWHLLWNNKVSQCGEKKGKEEGTFIKVASERNDQPDQFTTFIFNFNCSKFDVQHLKHRIYILAFKKI